MEDLKLCECGCGKIVKNRFIQGHNTKVLHPGWNGGKSINNGHPTMLIDGKYQRESRNIIQEILGYDLPKKAVVHHIDGNTLNNNLENLVVCENQAYHMLLHARQKALNDCGDSNKRKCVYCHVYDDLSNLKINKGCRHRYHQKCFNEQQKRRRNSGRTKC